MKKAILVTLLVVIAACVTYTQGWGAAPRPPALRVPPCVPTVSSVTPNRGPNTGGTTVALDGTCFTGATRVQFDGRFARSFQVLSDTEAQAVSPAFPFSVPGSVRQSILMWVCKGQPHNKQVRCNPRNPAANFTFFKPNGKPMVNGKAPRTASGKAIPLQAVARAKAALRARLKTVRRRQGAQRVRAEFLMRKGKLQAQWLAVRIARGRRLLATHRSAPAALRNILNRNVSSLVTLRQTVVNANRPLTGSFSANVNRVLYHGGIGTFHGVPPGAATPPPPPTITAVSSNYGQPGDQIIITGSGFGSTSPTVDFLLSSNAVGPSGTGSVQQAPIAGGYWTPTQIIVYVPNVSGISAYSGSLYVQTASGKSNALAFQFQPALDVQQLPIGLGNVHFGGEFCGFPSNMPMGSDVVSVALQGGTANVQYCSSLVQGSKGDDLYFQGNTLRNGWTLDSVNFDKSACGANTGGNGASIASSGQGTSTPYVDVHWWVDPIVNDFTSWNNGVACYTLGLTITGPLGTPW
jgi:hypothetical protein